MDGTITKTSPTSIPNLLTYGRIAAVPAMAAVFLLVEGDERRWIALTIFVIACITDWLDGYLARVWEQQSMLGRMLDPIADKLLVGAAIILLVQDGTISRIGVWAALIILSREILVSGLREFLAELCQMEDHPPDDSSRVPPGRPSRRSMGEWRDVGRERIALAGGASDDLDRRRLSDGRDPLGAAPVGTPGYAGCFEAQPI